MSKRRESRIGLHNLKGTRICSTLSNKLYALDYAVHQIFLQENVNSGYHETFVEENFIPFLQRILILVTNR